MWKHKFSARTKWTAADGGGDTARVLRSCVSQRRYRRDAVAKVAVEGVANARWGCGWTLVFRRYRIAALSAARLGRAFDAVRCGAVMTS